MSISNKDSGKRIILYKYLRGVSYTAFEEANENEQSRFNNLLVAMLFSAFCIEAFLNHVGETRVPFWKELEKGSPKLKLEVISRILNILPDYSKKPFRSFTPIFKFRNHYVHAHSNFISSNNDDEDPISKWEEQINLRNAKTFVDDTEDMIIKIGKAAGFDISNILTLQKPRKILEKLGPSSITTSDSNL